MTYAQDVLTFDGNLWEKLNDDAKNIYLVGLAHGEYLVRMTLNNMGETLVLESVDKEILDTRYVVDVRKSIDKFYNDNPDKKNFPICIVYRIMLNESRN